MRVKKILYIVNILEFFFSHRLAIASAAHKEGYEIHIASSDVNGIDKVEMMGFHHHFYPIARSGQNPVSELRSIGALYLLCRRLKPDLVHLITIKPVIYGGIAARLSGVKAVVAAVSGLGTVFMEQGVIATGRRSLVSMLYRWAFNHKLLMVIFQNPDDRDALLKIKVVHPSQTQIIRGSGVDLAEYPYLPEPHGTPVVTMAARLLRDKGVFEFAEAAHLLKDRNVPIVMRLIGSLDPHNVSSLNESDLECVEKGGGVELLGYRSDIAGQYAAANIVCLPSYREGLPKGLVEAAACGRAVVTTDVPGCRDAIVPNVTGVLVPVKNPVALADAIQALAESPDLRRKLGRAGRELAENAFAIENIVEQHLTIYRELLCHE